MFWRRRGKRESELDRELRNHLDLEAAEQLEQGISREEADYAARRAFGSVAYAKEEVRQMWGWTTIEQIGQDIRYALRGMRSNATFTAVAVISLALGIGATTAVFSVMNAVVLRPLPVEDPDALVQIQPYLRGKRFVLFNPIFDEIRASQKSLSGMFAVSDQPYFKAAVDGAPPEFVRGSSVSGNYFQVLGLTPSAGRLLMDSDDDPAAACAVVISHAFWEARFQAARDAVGRKMIIREQSCTIVGVGPEDFVSHQTGFVPQLWAPLRQMNDQKLLASRTMAFYSGILGRLRPGKSHPEASAELTAIYQRIQAAQPAGSPHPNEAAPKPADFRIQAQPGAQGLDRLRDQLKLPLMLVLAVAGVVLLIAVTNVANLLLARGASRTAELGTRAALGASRGRLTRQLGIEGGSLAVGGGLLGIALAWLGTPALARMVSLGNSSITVDATPDVRVIAVAFATIVGAGLLVGVLPALRLSGSGLQAGSGSRTAGTRSGRRMGRALVATQLALSLVLVTSAGLLLRTVLQVMSVDPGFKPESTILMNVQDTEPAAKYGETDSLAAKTRRAAMYAALEERLNSIAGVRAASVSWLGLFGSSYVGLNLHDTDRKDTPRFTLVDYVSTRYFDAVGMRILRGRGFTEADRLGALPVAVVNEAFIRERTGGADAIGRRYTMTYANEPTSFTIVGILRDAKYKDLREVKTEPMMWVPISQWPHKMSSMSLRVQPGTESAVIRDARAALAATSPDLMVRNVTTLRDQVDRATSRERLLLTLASVFGGLALVLAAVGLYGTLGYAVVRRTREIGVRIALGATRPDVLRMVLREALGAAAVGVLVGLPLTLAASRSIRSFLFGVSQYDLVTFGAAAAVLAAVALVAAWVPARQASRVDPLTALKYE